MERRRRSGLPGVDVLRDRVEGFRNLPGEDTPASEEIDGFGLCRLKEPNKKHSPGEMADESRSRNPA